MLDPIKDIIRLSGLPDPALHLLIGLGIYLITAALFRVPLGSWKPWLVTLACEVLNELADITRDLLAGNELPFRGSSVDIVVTMLLPTLIFSISRFRAHVRRKR